MKKCPACGHENAAETDFCERCGGYVRWELSGAVPAVRAPEGSPPAPPGPPRAGPAPAKRRREGAAPPRNGRVAARGERVVLTLSARSLQVAAGSVATLTVEVDNRTSVVDHFQIVVSGLPADWYTVTPSRIHLNPYGARGEHTGDAQIALHPPRAPGAEARAWQFTVDAISEDRQSQVASAAATLVIEPFHDFVVEPRPERRAGRRRGRFEAVIRNRGNAPVEVAVSVADDEQACRVAVEPELLTVNPGGEGRARFTARPRRPIWIGRPVDRSLQLSAPATRHDFEPPAKRVTFRQRPWIPWWLPVALALLAVLLMLAWKLMPRMTEVPDVRGTKSPFAAQKALGDAGLKLDPNPQKRVSPRAAPGTIIDQDPPAGEKVEKGSTVTVVQAVGSAMRTVPSVVGLSPQDADRALRERGLVLGTVQPEPTGPEAKIAAQVPDAGVHVKEGTAVNASLDADKKPGKTVAEKKEKEGAGTAAAGAGPGAAAGAGPGAATAAGPGAAGARTARLAFDDGENLWTWDPASDQAAPLTTSGTPARALIEPAWSADGSQVAYMRVGAGGRGRIHVVDVEAGESSARPVDLGKGDHHRPSISPDGALLAYIREDSTRGGRVCLQPNDGRPHVASCIAAGPWRLSGQAAWSPDSRSLLVIATPRAGQGSAGLIQLVTSAPGSPRASDWYPAGEGLTLPIANPNSVAWSPDGRQVAVMASPDGNRFHLFLVPADEAGITGTQRPVADVTGCEAAWHADGKLTVSVYDCGQAQAAQGQVVLLDPESPTSLTQLAGVHGRNPTWQPAAP
jgi:hypothetical protein